MRSISTVFRRSALAALLLVGACGDFGGSPAQAAGASIPVPGSEGDAARLVILHNNDLHFSFHHFGRFRDFVESVREAEPNVLLLSGGDIVVRHPHRWPSNGGTDFYRRRGREMMAKMNEAGYNAAVLGNHELYVHGIATAEILGAASFPWLAANIEVTTDALPRPAPYVSLTTQGGLHVLVLGLSVINFEPASGLAERDLFGTVRDYLPLARDHDVFVVLSHRGIRDDIDLANAFPEIDVIIGGHTHSNLTDGLTVNGVLIAQTGSLGHAPTVDGPVFLGVASVEVGLTSPARKCARVLRIGDDEPVASRPASDLRRLADCAA